MYIRKVNKTERKQKQDEKLHCKYRIRNNKNILQIR